MTGLGAVATGFNAGARATVALLGACAAGLATDFGQTPTVAAPQAGYRGGGVAPTVTNNITVNGA